MIRVKIDGVECDITGSEAIQLSFDAGSLTDLESGRTGQTISFRMALNATNCAIFGIHGDVHSAEKFNSTWHEMVIEAHGIELFRGTAYLMSVVWESSSRYVTVECRGGVMSWAETAAMTLFKNIEIPYENLLTEDNIKESWLDDSAVKFFPIVRDSYSAEGSSSDVTGVRLLRSIDDYHPFIKISALLEAIFAMEGFTVQSTTVTAEAFDELYISGNYSSSSDGAAALEAMGFYAKRSEATTTTTDSAGMVSFSPYMSAATVGNIVDVDTTISDSECYNRGGCLQLDGQELIYAPLTSVSVGFEYYLHYTCLCSIESRSRLKGIDTLNTIDNGYVKWEITNRYIDQRDELLSGIEYKLAIFDFDDQYTYFLRGVDASGTYTSICSGICSRFTSVTLSATCADYELYQYSSTQGYEACTSDWAMYFGYVEEQCSTEVKITVRSAAKECSPTSPMEFIYPKLMGADALVSFTLHEDTSLRPFFSNYPTYNSSITFEDIGQNSISALDFLSSLQHLFNLRFSTNLAAKIVTIESFDEFYSDGIWDWSDKIAEDEQVEFADLAHSAHRSTTYGYQQTDGVVQRMGQSDNLYFGEWTVEVESYAASSTDLTLLNPVFSASTNDEDGVMVVGDRDDVESVDSLSFSPRIARFFRMAAIEGENYELPYVAFHSPDDGFTLCFEDRDGVEGLNRLYQSEVALRRRGQLISITLKLSSWDYSNLFEPCEQSPSLGSIFCLSIDGESFKTILQSIESYNPETGRARCQFLTID